MSFFTFLLKKIAKIPSVDAFDNYLFIGPHPDDIEIGCGGTIARLVAQGKKVAFVIATDGRYGSPDPDKLSGEALVETRRKETLASAASLGVTDVTFLPYWDGGLYDPRELTKSLAAEIAKHHPDIVFCPDPLLHTECHADHLLTGRSASSAFIMCPNKLLMRDIGCDAVADPKALAYYYTARPNSYYALKGFQKKQFEALKQYKSQFTCDENGNGTLKAILLYLSLRSLHFGLPRLKGRAEGFRISSPMMTHCCAEKI